MPTEYVFLALHVRPADNHRRRARAARKTGARDQSLACAACRSGRCEGEPDFAVESGLACDRHDGGKAFPGPVASSRGGGAQVASGQPLGPLPPRSDWPPFRSCRTARAGSRESARTRSRARRASFSLGPPNDTPWSIASRTAERITGCVSEIAVCGSRARVA